MKTNNKGEDVSTLFDQIPSLGKIYQEYAMMASTDAEAEMAPIAAMIDTFLNPPNGSLDETVSRLNLLRRVIATHSPFSAEPVDLVEWVPTDDVKANDYNPNSVAPPEMELLRLSIMADGYTQPIVTMPDEDGRVVIDGFHRHRVGKEMPDVNARIHGYLPVVRIRQDRENRKDRIAATIRHNRARGKHSIDAMSDIVVELKRRSWSEERIGKELGMEPDEVLRLCQISGIAELFSDDEFSASWDAADVDDDFDGFNEEQV